MPDLHRVNFYPYPTQSAFITFEPVNRVTLGSTKVNQENCHAVKASTPRQKAVLKALRELVPLAPYADFEPIAMAIRSPHMRTLAPKDAAWLATIAHIRHNHTEYDQLRNEGYDHDSARFFIFDEINFVLSDWGATRFLSDEDDQQSSA